MRLAVLALVVSTLVHAGCAKSQYLGRWADFERHDAVADMPALARLDAAQLGGRTSLVLRGRLSDERAAELTEVARRVVADVNRRFIGGSSVLPRPPVDVCIFETSAEYEALVHAVYGEGDHFAYGFYMNKDRLLLVNLERSDGNLRHELVHPLLTDDYPGIPQWLNEGIASLYGSARYEDGEFRFLHSHRLFHLREAMRRAVMPNMVQLAHSDRRDVFGRAWWAYYAVSRYVLLYLEDRGTLDRFYWEMRRGQQTPRRQLALLKRYVNDRAFRRWARGLRYHRRAFGR